MRKRVSSGSEDEGFGKEVPEEQVGRKSKFEDAGNDYMAMDWVTVKDTNHKRRPLRSGVIASVDAETGTSAVQGEEQPVNTNTQVGSVGENVIEKTKDFSQSENNNVLEQSLPVVSSNKIGTSAEPPMNSAIGGNQSMGVNHHNQPSIGAQDAAATAAAWAEYQRQYYAWYQQQMGAVPHTAVGYPGGGYYAQAGYAAPGMHNYSARQPEMDPRTIDPAMRRF